MKAFRILALAVVIGAAACSLVCLFRVGGNNPSLLLKAMFVVWVLSPFAGIVIADIIGERWAPTTRAALHMAGVVTSIGSVVLYGSVAFGAPQARPAAMFLIGPLASWLALVISVATASFAAKATGVTK